MLARQSPRSLLAVLLVCGMAASLAATARAQDDRPVVPNLETRPADAALAKGADGLPVRKITLYRSGVGYFERAGEIADNAEIQLRFGTEQINDILKSMILLDRDGGRIESVQYGSKEPLAKRLASFGINIASNPSVPDLLNQLRGATLKVGVAGAEIVGTVLGVETRRMPGSKDQSPVDVPFLNLVTSTGVRSIAVPDISTFEIQDKELAGELNKALSALAEYRADRTKTVDLRFTGAGKRRVAVGYVHEMPVWKTSYRLLLPELDSEGKTRGQLTVQGWAIVENTTDQDWNNVQLSLVSGRPVSFQMDLYEPLFSARPWVAVPTIPGVAPRIFGLGIDADQLSAGEKIGRSKDAMLSNEMQAQSFRKMAAPAAAPAPMDANRPRGSARDEMYAGVTAAEMADYAPRAAASAASVGEMFQFQVDAPVSIERQRSAMIPIMTAAVTGRRVSIFNAADGSQFPMRGVEITNDSGLALLPGPLSVLDGAAYAGDAQIGQIPKNDKRMLAYALDLEMAVLTKQDSRSTMTRITIENGLIHQLIKDRLLTEYEFANKDTSHGRTLILEHPKAGGYELADTDKPSELTPDLYRFTIPIEAGKAKKFSVSQERTRYEDVAVTGYDLTTLVQYKRDGKVSDDVMAAFRKAADKQAAISNTERAIAELTAKMDEVSRDQTRIRQNMGAIDKTSQLYARYVTKLTDQESKLEDDRDQQAKLQKQLNDQRADLAEYLRTLNVR
ncbi:MAG TPA: hypothetical protein PKE29_15960 [Phycisphaerales bacterium]|nr:hypothetical protein [Phycisphaerales bacterium]